MHQNLDLNKICGISKITYRFILAAFKFIWKPLKHICWFLDEVFKSAKHKQR